MNRKMIFTLLNPIWGRIHEMEGNFEHLAHEPWPQTCGRIILKFHKKQMKSENHDHKRVEAMVKIEKVLHKLSRTLLTNRSMKLADSPRPHDGPSAVQNVRKSEPSACTLGRSDVRMLAGGLSSPTGRTVRLLLSTMILCVCRVPDQGTRQMTRLCRVC